MLIGNDFFRKESLFYDNGIKEVAILIRKSLKKGNESYFFQLEKTLKDVVTLEEVDSKQEHTLELMENQSEKREMQAKLEH